MVLPRRTRFALNGSQLCYRHAFAPAADEAKAAELAKQATARLKELGAKKAAEAEKKAKKKSKK